MTKITLKEALELVQFWRSNDGSWHVGDVRGNVCGDVRGDVEGSVRGDVFNTIKGRKWEFIETPVDKVRRLIEETGNDELIQAFKDMEEN